MEIAHIPLDISAFGDTHLRENETQMSPVIIDPICVFLWELSFDICELSVAVSQGILFSDMGYTEK